MLSNQTKNKTLTEILDSNALKEIKKNQIPGKRSPLFFTQEKELVELPKEIEERKK